MPRTTTTSRQYTESEVDALMARNAQFDHNSRVLWERRQRMQAGVIRQKTVAEIAADMEEARRNPPEVVRHASGSHLAILPSGQPYRCRECQ